MSHRGEEGEGPGEGGRGEGREEEEGEEEWKEGRRRIIREIAGQSHTLFCVRIRTAVTCQEADTLIHRDTMTCQLPSGDMREKRTELELCPDQNYARASGSRGLWNGTEGEGSGFSVGGVLLANGRSLDQSGPSPSFMETASKADPSVALTGGLSFLSQQDGTSWGVPI